MTAGAVRAPQPLPARARIAGTRQLALSMARQRLAAAILLLTLFTGVLGLRLVELALDREPATSAPALAGLVRGDITDRNGVLLATTYEAFALAVRPADVVADKDVLARQIHAILPDRPIETIEAALRRDVAFTFVARRILPEDADRLKKLGDPGLILEREPERLYPQGALAAHLVGFTGIEGKGSMGIERAFEARLSDRRLNAEPLALSIDARLQQVLESELLHQKERQSAEAAAGVVMNAHTGEVLAIASLPAFNPNAPGGLPGMPENMNRITFGVYELGSTFKPFTVAMGMDAGTIGSLADTYSTGAIRVGNHMIRDLHAKGRPITVPEAIIFSSNVATARMAEALGKDRQQAFLKSLGFLDRVPAEILERGRTLYPAEANWGQSAIMTIGFGHGMAVTPLHLASAYATLVNGGLARPATFLKVRDGEAPGGTRVFSGEASAAARAMLRLAVTQGTGRRADAAGYRVGGKTGTAEKPRPGGGYFHDQNVTTFAGAFPMDDPQLVVVVMLDNPRGDRENGGGRTAGATIAPAFHNVVLRIAPVMGVLPDTAKEPDLSMLAGLYEERRR
jgi:cell division protein FtsI (penicillin-binding protein 3)